MWAAQPYVPGARIYDRSLTEHVGVLWRGHAAIVGVMASGIMVRVIAPWLQSKLSDPGVVVFSNAGRFAISLLAGHEGGANRLGRTDRSRGVRSSGRDDWQWGRHGAAWWPASVRARALVHSKCSQHSTRP